MNQSIKYLLLLNNLPPPAAVTHTVAAEFISIACRLKNILLSTVVNCHIFDSCNQTHLDVFRVNFGVFTRSKYPKAASQANKRSAIMIET